MDCHLALECITAAVDGELDERLRPQLEKHLSDCSKCRAASELERMTKSFLRSRIHSAPAPAAVVHSVREMLAAESLPRAASTQWVQKLFVSPRRLIMVGAGIAAAVLLVLLNSTPSVSHHSHAQPFDDNIIHQAFNNFDGFLDGKMSPDVRSNNPATVRSFLVNAAKFSVNVPRLTQYRLLGGGCSQYKQQNVAHVLYQHNGEKIYLYQIPLCAIVKEGGLHLPAEVMSELNNGGWYVEHHVPDCTLIVWMSDSTVCCAIADINHNELLASLKESQ